MRKRNLIIGIVISAIISAGIVGIVGIIVYNTINKLNSEDDEYFRQTTLYIEGMEGFITHASGINFAGKKGITLTFSFTTKPTGLIEVYLNLWNNNNVHLFMATNIANYELVLPDDSCTLTFVNYELFDIIVSLNYSYPIT